jgi:regulatory protein
LSYPQAEFSTVENVVILSVAQHVSRPDRYSVTVKDEIEARHRLVLSDEDVHRAGLRVGESVDPAGLRDAAERIRAEDSAVAALARRGYAAREMELLLIRRGVSHARSAETVATLVAQGLIDDGRFAAQFARLRIASRGASVWSLRRDLGRRGVARAVADAAIAEAMEDAGISELDVARREAEKKWRSLSRLEPETGWRRLVAFLQRRGFGGDAIRLVAGELGASRRR